MNRFLLKRLSAILMCLILELACCSCMAGGANKNDSDVPKIPDRLTYNGDHVPVLKVYNTNTKKVEEMDIETYVMGVVAGEMKNDWPEEALKAQAVLARTFTMKFISDKKSKYDGADISTDVQEAQAYDADVINDRVREAVESTSGEVMVYDGEFPYAWFHAHSGGRTELPSKALEYNSDPKYLISVDSSESDKAPDSVKEWTAEFTLDQAKQACAGTGTDVGDIESFSIGEKGESGRAVTFKINGKDVSAPAFRLQIGADKLKSTLIDSVEIADNRLLFRGRGFGHGVGMSQWGAYQMAEDGKNAEDIINHYYKDLDLIELW